MKSILTLIASLAIFAPLASSASVIIYQDSFSGTGVLNGSTPDVVDTGSATWTSSTGFSNFSTSGGLANAFNAPIATLPFAVDGTSTYTLTLTVNVPNQFPWIDIGFTKGSYTTGSTEGNFSSDFWILQQGNGSTQGFAPGFGGTSVSAGNDHTYTFTLNSATGAASISVDGGSAFASGTLTGAQLASISGVGFANHSATGSTFDNFTLTNTSLTIPEPSTWALILGSGVVLVAFQRMRRIQS